jgi:hypothetical protein
MKLSVRIFNYSYHDHLKEFILLPVDVSNKQLSFEFQSPWNYSLIFSFWLSYVGVHMPRHSFYRHSTSNGIWGNWWFALVAYQAPYRSLTLSDNYFLRNVSRDPRSESIIDKSIAKSALLANIIYQWSAQFINYFSDNSFILLNFILFLWDVLNSYILIYLRAVMCGPSEKYEVFKCIKR